MQKYRRKEKWINKIGVRNQILKTFSYEKTIIELQSRPNTKTESGKKRGAKGGV